MDRRYEPSAKHKAPLGFGSHCPKMPPEKSQTLLESAILEPDKPNGSKLYAVWGDWCFVAQPTRSELGTYHGYPVPGHEVPPSVLRTFQTRGDLSREQRLRLQQQTSLPERDPGDD